MIIILSLHAEYCELVNKEKCPCIHEDDDMLTFTHCQYFGDTLGGKWVDGNGGGYHILRLANCKNTDGAQNIPAH
jgi:hypothetical protein